MNHGIAGYSGGYKTNRGSLKNTRVAAFNDQGRNALKGENGIRQNSQWAWINKGTADNFEQPYLNKVKGIARRHSWKLLR